ncbi:MAG: NADPH:quinone reductase [Deltaproteobacteria bacterium]|nr:NADPH:quinone reductase [Deltaproteobacteria bacterium]
MKAIIVRQFGDPDVMKVEDISIPEPLHEQVLIAVRAAGVNPVDTYIRSGQYAKKPELPYTPGMDGAGVVQAVGPRVKRFSAGDRVYIAGSISGTYAEYALCLESHTHALPDQVSFEQGASLGVPYGIAYRALFHRAFAKPGDTVLIHGGTGGVGIAAIQLARSHGMNVMATAGSDTGLEFLIAQGARHVFNHRIDDHFEQIITKTNGVGVDIILEMAAHSNLGRDLKILAGGGRVVVIGSRGPVEIDARDAMSRDASILGVLLFNASDDELATIHAALGAGLENGTIRPVIGKTFSLNDSPLAHKSLMTSTAHGKIVLMP